MIIERIKRKIEPNMCITEYSTPIIYFGNYNESKACTISLNPSNKEFVNNANILLDYSNRERLCSRIKLKKGNNVELTDDDAETVLNYCNNYFNLRPLRLWFNPINNLINYLGNYSYYDNSCVNLDLVQWATTPKWSDVPPHIMQKHLENDLPVLKYLLEKKFDVIFLNGKTTVTNVSECLNINLNKKYTVFRNSNGIEKNLEIFVGKYNNIKVLGWNLYLQNAIPGNENIKLFSNIIKTNI